MFAAMLAVSFLASTTYTRSTSYNSVWPNWDELSYLASNSPASNMHKLYLGYQEPAEQDGPEIHYEHEVPYVPEVPEVPLACEGGDSCCTWDNKCYEGEGDCDQDQDCLGDLVCGQDNCKGGDFDSTDDCCEKPRDKCLGGDNCCTDSCKCALGEGDCDYHSQCGGRLVCGFDNCQGLGFDSTDDCCRESCDGGDSCCSRTSPCLEGEGDCDRDHDCEAGLVCGRDNCRGRGFDGSDDCCEKPEESSRCRGGDSCCSQSNLCGRGEGDCDRDSDCHLGLRCGKDNCLGRGFDSTDDCCV